MKNHSIFLVAALWLGCQDPYTLGVSTTVSKWRTPVDGPFSIEEPFSITESYVNLYSHQGPGTVPLQKASAFPQDALGQIVCGEGILLTIPSKDEAEGLLEAEGIAILFQSLDEVGPGPTLSFCGHVVGYIGPTLQLYLVSRKQ